VIHVVSLAARLFADESGLDALTLQQPSAATEGEALQFRGRNVALSYVPIVSHGAYACSAALIAANWFLGVRSEDQSLLHRTDALGAPQRKCSRVVHGSTN